MCFLLNEYTRIRELLIFKYRVRLVIIGGTDECGLDALNVKTMLFGRIDA